MNQPSERRGTAASRGYGHKWRKAREAYLKQHPLCVFCQQRGRLTPATVVDHIEPHRGDMKLFWRRSNWQSLCKPCHDRDKARIEAGGALPGCDDDGMPLDPGHHWR
ncbi:HNH endonuclease [Chromohalobacter israelensis]|uniref:HNH endonuclease n=1 Tax=Chromohalobacter israelensis TaxID=141390 RepID=UPI00265B7AF5|nr:HNH endonuclease signature motif containing protein [Chromohalobacter salexigens]MDO0945928.1 HNH endonuclease signature motif containing protein [Chromohalobacter salexigens]